MLSFTELLEKTYPGIQGYASKSSNGSDSLCDDLVQEAYLAVLRVHQKYDDKPDSDVIKLAGVASKNAIINHMRRHNMRTGEELDLDPSYETDHAEHLSYLDMVEVIRSQLHGRALEFFDALYGPGVIDDDGPKGPYLRAKFSVSKATVSRTLKQIQNVASANGYSL